MTTEIQPSTAPEKKQRLRTISANIFTKIVYGIVAIYILLWLFSPLIIRHYLGNFLKQEYNLTLSEESSFRYNPFLSHLSVRDITLHHNQQKVLQIQQLDFQLHLYRLLLKQLYLSEFSVSGIYLYVDKATDLIIAGIKIPPAGENKKIAEETQPSSLELMAPKIQLANSEIELNLNNSTHKIQLSSFSINNFKQIQGRQQFAVALKALIDAAPVTFSTQVDLSHLKNRLDGKITSQLNIKHYQLNNIQHLISLESINLKGNLNFSAQATIAINNNAIKVSIPETDIRLLSSQLALKSLQLTSENQHLLLKNTTIQHKQEHSAVTIGDLQLSIANSQGKQDALLFDNQLISVNAQKITAQFIQSRAEKLSFEAAINLGKTATYITDRKHTLAAFDAADINHLTYSSDQLAFEDFELSQLLFSSLNSETKQPPLTEIKRVQVNSFEFSNQLATIKSINVHQLGSHILIDKTKKIANLVDLSLLSPSVQTSKATTQKKIVTAVKTPSSTIQRPENSHIRFSIEQIKFIDTQPIQFSDKSVSPPYQRDIYISQFHLNNINSIQPETPATFELIGKSNTYTRFNFNGTIKPFIPKLNMTVKGAITELPLPQINAYIQSILGFNIASGNLDSNIDIKIKNSNISGKTHINIRGFELGVAKNYQANQLKESTAMPLNVALGMLKDSDGNVELDIPMLGNVDNPSFGISSFIALVTKQAIEETAKQYLIRAFLPYADVIKMTLSAGKFIMKLRFEDLIYEPGQIDISEKQQTYVNKFIQLMKDKNKTMVKVCAYATAEELPEETFPTEKDKINWLNNIAQQRAEQFKKYITQHQIESSRLLLCAPKIELKKSGKPRISLSI